MSNLPDDYLEADFELLYWQFDARHRGHGRFAESDGTPRPQSERDAFKNALRDWEYLHYLEKLRRAVSAQGGVTAEVHGILGHLREIHKKTRKDVG